MKLDIVTPGASWKKSMVGSPEKAAKLKSQQHLSAESSDR
jgi:hypothetical protein